MSQVAKNRRTSLAWQPLAEILGSLLTLALIICTAAVAFFKVEEGMSWDAGFRVVNVLSGGPADRAGIQLGDRIVAIDGQPVDAWRLPIMRWRPGYVLSVAVERDGQYLARAIQLEQMSLSRRWEAVWPLIIAMSFWAFSSLMPGLARQNTEVRLFRAFSLVGGAALAAGNLSGSGLIGAAHLFGVLVGVLAPLILHFHLVLMGIRLGRWQWPVLAVIYAAGAAVAIP